jgi:tetratricopeptide (TPR) repeat protein
LAGAARDTARRDRLELRPPGRAGARRLSLPGRLRRLLRTFTSLTDQSLLSSDPEAGAHGPRFRLLETLNDYARERLVEAGEADAVRERHATYYLALVEQTTPRLAGLTQAASLELLDREYENLRVALNWLLETPGPAGDDGLRMVSALGRFWEASGRLTEGSTWLRIALERTGAAPSVTRARALNVAGNFARLRGDYAAARHCYIESSEVARLIGDQRAAAMPLANQGNLAWDQGDYSSARAAFSAAHRLLRELGDRRTAALVESYLGAVACDQGDYEEAVERSNAALSEFRALDDAAGTASVLTELGEVAYAQQDLKRAMSLFQESLRLRRGQGDLHEIARSLRHVGKSATAMGDGRTARETLGEALGVFQRVQYARGIALVLEHIGQLAIGMGDPRRGVRLCSAASALHAQSGSVLPPSRSAIFRAGAACGAHATGPAQLRCRVDARPGIVDRRSSEPGDR